VNPSQFGPQEDLAKYPRTLDADLDRLASCQIAPGALWVFAPTDSEVYKPGHGTWVEPQGVALPLEGRLRPGHFRGVATVVLKMFNMVQPHKAFFGRKDFQQLRVIEQMAEDLDLSVEIVGCPIVREADGLALSSRNIYLNTVARAQARVLSQALELARQLVAGGERKAAAIAAAMVTLLEAAGNADAGPVKIDYVALVDPRTLEDVHTVSGPTLAALAVRVGSTRLIDNCLLEA
jgi:pantoate--beta-alanine ligase